MWKTCKKVDILYHLYLHVFIKKFHHCFSYNYSDELITFKFCVRKYEQIEHGSKIYIHYLLYQQSCSLVHSAQLLSLNVVSLMHILMDSIYVLFF